MLSRRAPLALVLALATISMVGAGCSNGSTVAAKRPHSGTGTASEVSGVQQVRITTGNDLRFHPSTLVVRPGPVEIVLVNTEQAGNGPPHDVQITGLPGKSPTAFAGNSITYRFTAPSPGRYRFVCTFHAEQGQTGTLIVEKA